MSGSEGFDVLGGRCREESGDLVIEGSMIRAIHPAVYLLSAALLLAAGYTYVAGEGGWRGLLLGSLVPPGAVLAARGATHIWRVPRGVTRESRIPLRSIAEVRVVAEERTGWAKRTRVVPALVVAYRDGVGLRRRPIRLHWREGAQEVREAGRFFAARGVDMWGGSVPLRRGYLKVSGGELRFERSLFDVERLWVLWLLGAGAAATVLLYVTGYAFRVAGAEVTWLLPGALTFALGLVALVNAPSLYSTATFREAVPLEEIVYLCIDESGERPALFVSHGRGAREEGLPTEDEAGVPVAEILQNYLEGNGVEVEGRR